MEQAIESVDDSDGEMGGLLERLRELHLAACRVARPDPAELAARRRLHAAGVSAAVRKGCLAKGRRATFLCK